MTHMAAEAGIFNFQLIFGLYRIQKIGLALMVSSLALRSGGHETHF